jgi:hypothetical protein
MKRPRVAYVYPASFRYRAPFNERMRVVMDQRGVDYEFIHTDAEPGGRGDTVKLAWSTLTPMIELKLGGRTLGYQAALKASWDCDLVIVQQENALLGNYPIQFLRRLAGKRVAFFGHGKNFQSDNPGGLSEKFKKFLTKQVDWWFAYTDLSARIVAETGYPAERITVFNNAIDMTALLNQKATVTAEEVETLRRERFAGSHNIAEAVKAIRAKVPDFQFIVIGGGSAAHLVQAAAEENPWIHPLGPLFGREKTVMASLAKAYLMPGLVGLGVLDSFAYGTPMITCDIPIHSPEIDYLKDGVNGVIVRDADSVEAYAAAVARVLTDEPYRAALVAGGAEAITTYTIESMADRFADGVMQALASPPLRGRLTPSSSS